MRIKCIQGHWAATDGFLGIGAKPMRPIDGLTEGKVYTGNLVPLVFSVMEGTRIDASDIKVMIYNDNGDWHAYQLNLFEPAND